MSKPATIEAGSGVVVHLDRGGRRLPVGPFFALLLAGVSVLLVIACSNLTASLLARATDKGTQTSGDRTVVTSAEQQLGSGPRDERQRGSLAWVRDRGRRARRTW